MFLLLSLGILIFVIGLIALSNFLDKQEKQLEEEINMHIKTIEKSCENLKIIHANDQKVLDVVNKMMSAIKKYQKEGE
jgi:hypothetical protein